MGSVYSDLAFFQNLAKMSLKGYILDSNGSLWLLKGLKQLYLAYLHRLGYEFSLFLQKSSIFPWQHSVLSWSGHLSPKYNPLGSFWPNFEKTLNRCKQTPKFEKLRFFLFDQFRLINSFPESGQSFICDFLSQNFQIKLFLAPI